MCVFYSFKPHFPNHILAYTKFYFLCIRFHCLKYKPIFLYPTLLPLPLPTKSTIRTIFQMALYFVYIKENKFILVEFLHHRGITQIHVNLLIFRAHLLQLIALNKIFLVRNLRILNLKVKEKYLRSNASILAAFTWVSNIHLGRFGLNWFGSVLDWREFISIFFIVALLSASKYVQILFIHREPWLLKSLFFQIYYAHI